MTGAAGILNKFKSTPLPAGLTSRILSESLVKTNLKRLKTANLFGAALAFFCIFTAGEKYKSG